MTAFIIPAAARSGLGELGAEFTVLLSASGTPPETHVGCNWIGCPPDVLQQLGAVPSNVSGPDWHTLCNELDLVRIDPDQVTG